MPGSTADNPARGCRGPGAVMRIVICGGGVIGASIAYFLSRRDVKPIVVERAGIACAASGKSGGFLARHWCDGTPLQQLARHSFDLHAELAEHGSEDWGYRRVTTYGGGGAATAHTRGGTTPNPINWVSSHLEVGQQLGSTRDTAQVHPALFTAAMMRAAEAHGGELRLGTVTGMRQAARRVTGIEVDGAVIDADAVIIAMGPWSILAAAWLPLHGLRRERPQPRFRDRRHDPARGAVSRIRGSGRRGAIARILSPPRRHDLCLRDFERQPAADRSRGGRPGFGCHRAVGAHLRRRFARARCGKDCRAPSLLSPDRP